MTYSKRSLASRLSSPWRCGDSFINDAIASGERGGLHLLDHTQRAIFLLSELEVSCDKAAGD